MSKADQKTSKPLHFGLLLLISFAIFNLGFIVEQTVRWSNHLEGFACGVFHVVFLGFAWCVYLLPWSLLIFVFYRWRKWRRFRAYWVLAPAVLFMLAPIGGLILYPPTPSHRFKHLAKTELPGDIQNLHFHFSGGGMADYSDTYYFETSPEEVDRLISDMGLEEDLNFHNKRSDTSVSALPDCPDFTSWPDAKQYRRHDDGWFYYLITDASKSRVYILIFCI